MGIINKYVDYIRGTTEAPMIYHRWCCLSSVGALAGRKMWLQHGHFRVFPNLYVMLIGQPAARKSTSIKVSKKLLSAAGYRTFAADKSSKEKFLMDLAGQGDGNGSDQNSKDVNITDINLWGDDADSLSEPREVFVVADEFNEFSGQGNLEFYTTLGNLWDWDDENNPFKQRFKTSQSVSIFQPYVSILGGNTPENFSRAFPPEIIGQGFLSRLLIIHGERTGVKLTFPPVPAQSQTDTIVQCFAAIRNMAAGSAVKITPAAMRMLDTIYQTWEDLDDVRFKSYSNRRFSQLLKLCLVHAAAELSTFLTPENVVMANTTLSVAETQMARGLGEFGKSKTSDVAHKVMDFVMEARKPLMLHDIWQVVHKDLERMQQLSEIIQNLQAAGRITTIRGKGLVAVRKSGIKGQHIDLSLLTTEETEGMAR